MNTWYVRIFKYLNRYTELRNKYKKVWQLSVLYAIFQGVFNILNKESNVIGYMEKLIVLLSFHTIFTRVYSSILNERYLEIIE